MRVLLDESVPRQLAPLLTGHDVQTVPYRGWAGLGNGELLRLAAREFDVFVTGDQSLEHQQDPSSLNLGVVVVAARDNRVETYAALAPRILEAVNRVQGGQVVHVAA